MKTYKIRTEVELTLDFEITATCEAEARYKVEHYLKYVQGMKFKVSMSKNNSRPYKSITTKNKYRAKL